MTTIPSSLTQGHYVPTAIDAVKQKLDGFINKQNLTGMIAFLQKTAESYTFRNELRISNLTPELSKADKSKDAIQQRRLINLLDTPLLSLPRTFATNHAEKIEDAQISLLRFKLSLASQKDNNEVALFGQSDREQISDIVNRTRTRLGELSLEKLQEKNRALSLLTVKYQSGFFGKFSLHYLFDLASTHINNAFFCSNKIEIAHMQKRLKIATKIEVAVTKYFRKG